MAEPREAHTCNLQGLQPPCVFDTEIGKSLLLKGLLLGLHNVGQASVPRLVQPQIRSNNHGQLGAKSLNTTIDLVGNLNGTSLILNVNFAGLRSLGPPEETSKHLTSLTLVTVNSLLTEKHEVHILLLNNGLQHLGDGQWLRATVALLRYVNVESSIGAHGHGGAEDVRAFRAAGGKCQDIFDLDGALALAKADGLFD